MNWTQVIESLGSVAVVVLPPLVMHYRKLGQILEILTTVLESASNVEKKLAPPPYVQTAQNFAAPVQQTLPGSGMVNENSD